VTIPSLQRESVQVVRLANLNSMEGKCLVGLDHEMRAHQWGECAIYTLDSLQQIRKYITQQTRIAVISLSTDVVPSALPPVKSIKEGVTISTPHAKGIILQKTKSGLKN
jgi:hypothetical protein